MADKNIWDKFELGIKFVETIVIAGIIGYSANQIAYSLERGKLIQSLISALTNNQIESENSIALVALDLGIPPPKKCFLIWLFCSPDPERDHVIDIARIIAKQNTSNNTSPTASAIKDTEPIKRIVRRRSSDKYFNQEFEPYNIGFVNNNRTTVISSVDLTQKSAANKIKKQEIVSEIVKNLQPINTNPSVNKNLSGIERIFIQYKSNKTNAEKLQKCFQGKGIFVPEIEQVNGITQNDIRYSNNTDNAAAQNLQKHIKKCANITIEDRKLINLNERGYQVPSGQFEIWLKD